MRTSFQFRDATGTDRPFLIDMLVEGANWSGDRHLDRMAALARPDLAHYVRDWPLSKEIGVIAEAQNQAIGACWLRFFTSDDPGYGYISDEVPELSIAVAKTWRGRGVGRLLLRKTADRAMETGIARICLSVERANRAHELYASEGYQIVERGADADTMVVVL